MAPVPPRIYQAADFLSPLAPGGDAATIVDMSGEAESYALSDDDGGNFALKPEDNTYIVSVAAGPLSGVHTVAVTVTGPSGTSDPGVQALYLDQDNPLPVIITPTVTGAVTAGTVVANVTRDPADVSPGTLFMSLTMNPEKVNWEGGGGSPPPPADLFAMVDLDEQVDISIRVQDDITSGYADTPVVTLDLGGGPPLGPVPLAPVITQIVPTDLPDPTPAGTVVAQIAQPPGDPATGITYVIASDPSGSYSVSDDTLLAARDLDGAFFLSIVAENATGTSPEGGATLVFADDNPYDDMGDKKQYDKNPQIPPGLPPDASSETPWDMYLIAATLQLMPHARNGVDFRVMRDEKYQRNKSIYWDAVLLGPRPDAEIEALAKKLAAEDPYQYKP